ncbi:hypothetical protein ACX0HA_03300 [Flavobacterium hauense]
MRYLNLIVIILIFTGCSSKRKVVDNKIDLNGIVYVLPYQVTQRLALIDMGDTSNVCFFLEKIEDFKYRIYLEHYEENDNWAKHTNRYISISGKLYPLTFELDMIFANTEPVGEFLQNNSEGKFMRTHRYTTRDWGFHIDFTHKGEILYEGN